jgi:hypothetical protein
MAIRMKFNGQPFNVPVASMREEALNLTATDFEVGLLVGNEEALTFACDKSTVLTRIYSENFLIKGEVQAPSVSGLRVSHTTLKDVSHEVLVNELLTFMNDTRNFVNKRLQEGLSVP